MTADRLPGGTRRLLWHTLRPPVFTFLAILEPVVRFIFGGLALFEVLTALFFELYGAPHFPFVRMPGMSVGLGLLLAGYRALLRLFGS